MQGLGSTSSHLQRQLDAPPPDGYECAMAASERPSFPPAEVADVGATRIAQPLQHRDAEPYVGELQRHDGKLTDSAG